MKKEIDALAASRTWFAKDLPVGKWPIDCKWVYKVKQKADGSVGYKARLMAKGFTQVEELDFHETFALVS